MARIGSKLVLSKSPLSLVLCQVRFSALLNMSKLVPDFHEAIRSTYPVNASGQYKEVQLLPNAPPIFNEGERWEFLTRDRFTSVVLDKGFVVLQTTKYEDFDAFLERMQGVILALNAATDGILLQRIGLRYVDAIVSAAGSSWKDYVQPCLAGFESKLFDEQQALRLHQTVATTSAGTMLVRLHQNRDGSVLPPDLAGGQLRPRIESEKGSLTTLLDIDHFRTCQDDEFDAQAFDAALWDLKNGAFTVFHDSLVTDFAIKAWT